MNKLMDEMSLGLIYTIKFHGFNKKAIIDYISDFIDSPRERISDHIVATIVKNSFCSCIETCDCPGTIIANFFDLKEKRQIFKELYPKTYKRTDFENDEDIETILSIFQGLKVKNKDKFVNGFSSKENVFKDFPNAKELMKKHFGEE